MTRPDRRSFLKQAGLASGLAVSAPLSALARRSWAGRIEAAEGFGPLAPVADEVTGLPLMALPRGFRYRSLAWTGDAMSNGLRTPGAPDGMAALAGRDGLVQLIRNHELQRGPAFAPEIAYDPHAGGGTTTLSVDSQCRVLGARASLSGTLRNCAGGVTPWASWLTCEESVLGPSAPLERFDKPHGYVFEVPLDGETKPTPLVAMGRFVHEAVAVDPRSGVVFETEDARRSGFYRFIPATAGRLSAGGRLQMLAIDGRPGLDLRGAQPSGVRYGVHWVDIVDPDRAHADPAEADGGGVFSQGQAAGGATFARLEGAWYAEGKVFVTSTDGGRAAMGQVWELDVEREQLRLIYESPGAGVLNMPDNLTVSPRGGLVLCEDGTANPCIHGLTRDGQLFRFARNMVRLAGERNAIAGDFTGSEFAGAVFSPDGRWLFVNVQSPGITFAITGPWERDLI